MPRETYDDLEWEIGTLPIGSSTPDHYVEYLYDATATCPNCGSQIEGTAHFYVEDDAGDPWLEFVDYEKCECELEDDEWDFDDDDDEKEEE